MQWGGLCFAVAKILLAGWVWGGNIDRLVLIKEVIHTSIPETWSLFIIFLCPLLKQEVHGNLCG